MVALSRKDPADPGSITAAEQVGELAAAFEESPLGLTVVDGHGTILSMNKRAVELLLEGERPPRGLRCCDVICDLLRRQGRGARRNACLTQRVTSSADEVEEERLEVEIAGVSSLVSVTAVPINAGAARAVYHLQPERQPSGDRGLEGDSRRRAAPRPRLRIHTLGRTQVEVGGQDLGGDWLMLRPGQLLNYLLCARHRVATSEQISEALWPGANQPWTTSSVRHQIHVLRDKLEPDRDSDTPSQFVVTRRGGYMLDSERVWIDADEFEDAARAGLDLFVQGELESATPLLERAVGLYGGDFLSDDPYVEWALEERDRLRELAGRVLRDLCTGKRMGGDMGAAADHARRLASMEPFDMDVQREFLELCIARGRRSEAMRRYAVLRRRVRSEFGDELDFSLADLEVADISG
jgi:DNA-binding SARP family transcriptional activator